MRFRAVQDNEKRRPRLRNNWKLNLTSRSGIFAGLGMKYGEAQDLIARLEKECPLLSASPRGVIA